MNSIATLYNDVNRIFLEYIDNSLDSAEDFFNKETNSYSKPINITIKIDGNTNRDGKVVIQDNCTGMPDLEKVVLKIGNSDKKEQPWTNGQFGYGIYSFMAACDNLNLVSKFSNKNAFSINIPKTAFDVDELKDVKLEDLKPVNFEEDTGTKVVLTGFNKTVWKEIDFNELKSEIEKHFEFILTRNNLKITFNKGNQVTLCKPFDYNKYECYPFDKELKDLPSGKSGIDSDFFTIKLTSPIIIFLRLSEKEVLDKPPVFIKSGRRIAAVKDIKKFKSNNKSKIWGHPRLTGYIDLGDFLSPTIARTDFALNPNSRALFNYLLQIEGEILEFIADVNKEQDHRHYNVLEDYLNKSLAKLAKLDLMNYRTEYGLGNDHNLEGGGSGNVELVEGIGGKDRGDGTIENPGGNSIGENEGDGIGYQDVEGDVGSPDHEKGDGASNKMSDYNDSDFKGSERKKSGFNIQIIHMPPPEKDGVQVRSELIGGSIKIYSKHPEFETRVDVSRQGEKRITQRLITYMAGEITVHYKDTFYCKTRQNPQYGKDLFVDLVSFVYKFEDMLKGLDKRNLADVSE